jgi:peptidoglycan/LPS O-acetylase OafA/YrhL
MENDSLQPDNAEKNADSIFSGEEFSMAGYDKHIRQARNAIFVAAAVLAINLIILAASIPDSYEYLWLDMCIWGAFLAGFIVLGFWTRKKPYSAIVGALILYAVFIALNASLDITTLYKGAILKVIIIVLLVKGLKDAREAQRLKEQLGR